MLTLAEIDHLNTDLTPQLPFGCLVSAEKGTRAIAINDPAGQVSMTLTISQLFRVLFQSGETVRIEQVNGARKAGEARKQFDVSRDALRVRSLPAKPL